MSDTGCVQIFVSLVAVITLLLKAAVKKKKKRIPKIIWSFTPGQLQDINMADFKRALASFCSCGKNKTSFRR